MGQQRHRLRRQQLPWSQTSQVFGPWKASLTNLDRPAEKKAFALAHTYLAQGPLGRPSDLSASNGLLPLKKGVTNSSSSYALAAHA
eukprot:scaffold40002_cov17-Tisochrysis_lutea.AAC.1